LPACFRVARFQENSRKLELCCEQVPAAGVPPAGLDFLPQHLAPERLAL
jgi:hypothetical protein